MRIVASHATALTIRHPRIAPETKAGAPMPARAVAPLMPPLAPPPAHLVQYGTPDAGFVMQLIATATTNTANDDSGRPARNAVSAAYGYVGRATRPLPPDNRIVRSI
ncbi:MAG: hypothetical protein ACTHNN_07740 [Xanthobacteraceae bacterium]